MTDLYLKTTPRAALVEKLTAAGLMDGDTLAPDVLLDEIGALEGVTGYHANLRLMVEPTPEQLAALGTAVVADPKTPYRVRA